MERSRIASAVVFLLLGFLLQAVSPATAARPSGKPKKLLYILAEFADKSIGGGPGGADISDHVWKERLEKLNATAEEYWVYNSYGVISGFESTYTEVFQLPAALTDDSPYQAGKEVQRIRVDMLEAAKEAGYKTSEYDEFILSFPGVPGFPAGALGGGGFVWMPGADPFDGGVIHEYGHAIGVGHASSFEGPTPYPGEHREGRDGLFMMGSEGKVAPIRGRPHRGPINLPMRYKLGFVGEELIHRVTTADRKPIRLSSFDREGLDQDHKRKRKLAIVFKHDNREWWITYAPTLAFRWPKESKPKDARGSVWFDGITLHELTGGITRVVDFTPGSQGSGNGADYIDTRDGALRVGQSYTFSDGGPTISPTRVGQDRDGAPWIMVRVAPPRR